MPKLRWIPAAAGLLLGGILCGDAADSGARYSVHSWEPRPHGLPQSSVISMTQGADGYLWLGTLNGLVRFDGNDFTTFGENNTPGLKSSEIYFLFADSRNDLWIGTKSAGIFLVKNGRVEPVPSEPGFHAGPLKSACEDSSGSVWLYTQDGWLLHYHAGSIGVGAQSSPTNPARSGWAPTTACSPPET
jgi:ligand-binding sensor domain-containing protein